MFQEYDDIFQLRSAVTAKASSGFSIENVSSKTWKDAADNMHLLKDAFDYIGLYATGMREAKIALVAAGFSKIAEKSEEIMRQKESEAKKREDEANAEYNKKMQAEAEARSRETARQREIENAIQNMIDRNREHMNSRDFLRDYRDMPDRPEHGNMA
nr:hypothetical protein [uncultured Acinetobacter sp.]